MYRQSLPEPSLGLRLLTIGIATLNSLVSGTLLFLGATDTAHLYGWQMSPLTAVSIGAFFLGAVPMGLMALRAGSWNGVHAFTPPVIAFQIFVIPATLLHWNALNFDNEHPIGLFIAFAWLPANVLCLVTTALGLLVRARDRRAALQRIASRQHAAAPAYAVPTGGLASPTGRRSPRVEFDDEPVGPLRQPVVPIPRLIVAPFAMGAVVLALFGLYVYAAPSGATLWPWALSRFDAMVLASCMLAIAVGIVTTLRAGDLWRMAPNAAMILVAGLLGIAGVLRYPSALLPDAGTLRPLIFVVVSAVGIGIGGATLIMGVAVRRR